MKRYILSFLLVAVCAMNSFARGVLTFSQAQEQAYFLSDKMAYELDLTPYQFDQVYQINLEYFLNVAPGSANDFYWQCRNADLNYVLYDWQYARFARAAYFYRPVEWRASDIFLALWNLYRPSYYFYSRPSSWKDYRGGIWVNRKDYRISPFQGRRPSEYRGGMRRHTQVAPPPPPAKPGRDYYNKPGNGNNKPGNGNNKPGRDYYNKPGNGNNKPGAGAYSPQREQPSGVRGGNSGNSQPQRTDRSSNASRGGGR